MTKAVLRVLIACLLVLVVTPASARKSPFAVLYKFGDKTGPRGPVAGPILDAAGNLYGVTEFGGAGECSFYLGCGTVYRLSPDGTLTTLHKFADNTKDGGFPLGGIALDAHGYLFGTTWLGGAAGGGTVFELDETGKERVLYSFAGASDGGAPAAGVVVRRGIVYGTTLGGGDSGGTCPHYTLPSGCGVIYAITKKNTERVIHAFAGGDDGANPRDMLIADQAGNLYGTTVYGGNGTGGCDTIDDADGCGTVFKIAADGTETILHRFQGYPTDGANPYGSVMRDKVGNIYGMTLLGGASSDCQMGDTTVGCGTIFRIAPDGTEILLYQFSNNGNGLGGASRLVPDQKGDLFGIGGNVAFRLAPDGSITPLYYFPNDGSHPTGEPNPDLATNESGELFGSTYGSSRVPRGTVFRLEQ